MDVRILDTKFVIVKSEPHYHLIELFNVRD